MHCTDADADTLMTDADADVVHVACHVKNNIKTEKRACQCSKCKLTRVRVSSVSLAARPRGAGLGACAASTACDQAAQAGHTDQAVEAVLAPLMPPRTMLCAHWRGWLLGQRSAAGAAGFR